MKKVSNIGGAALNIVNLAFSIGLLSYRYG